jgi:hypothetical protein
MLENISRNQMNLRFTQWYELDGDSKFVKKMD